MNELKEKAEYLTRLDVNNRYIELNRDDLQFKKESLPIEKITILDFKSSRLSRVDINKAELIVFVDGERTKELKNKYAPFKKMQRNNLQNNQKNNETSESDVSDVLLLQIKELFAELTDDQRMEVMDDYCKYCGRDDNGCQCWNDD